MEANAMRPLHACMVDLRTAASKATSNDAVTDYVPMLLVNQITPYGVGIPFTIFQEKEHRLTECRDR